MQEQIELKKKLASIENEIDRLKAMVINPSQSKKRKKIIKLEGLWKGVHVTEEDIEDAKKSLFKYDVE
ncbi:hypothetical protein HYS31_00185 [Candidatus Woesearchaeota archaeon]|nr:hypothetical protein [Candidatus Woesearchaeota archaeon]